MRCDGIRIRINNWDVVLTIIYGTFIRLPVFSISCCALASNVSVIVSAVVMESWIETVSLV